MAVLAADPQQLEGWGKIKKKLKLNKLGTRKLAAKVAKVVPGAVLLAPSKQGFKNAGKGVALTAAVAATVVTGGKALPMIMSAKQAMDARKAAKVAGAETDAAVQEIEQQAADYAQQLMQPTAAPAPVYAESADPRLALPAETASATAVTATSGERVWPRYLLWGSVGLLVVGLALRGNQQRNVESR